MKIPSVLEGKITFFFFAFLEFHMQYNKRFASTNIHLTQCSALKIEDLKKSDCPPKFDVLKSMPPLFAIFFIYI